MFQCKTISTLVSTEDLQVSNHIGHLSVEEKLNCTHYSHKINYNASSFLIQALLVFELDNSLWWGLSCAFRISGLYPLDDGSTPSSGDSQNAAGIAKYLPGSGELSLVKNHCYTEKGSSAVFIKIHFSLFKNLVRNLHLNLHIDSNKSRIIMIFIFIS